MGAIELASACHFAGSGDAKLAHLYHFALLLRRTVNRRQIMQ